MKILIDNGHGIDTKGKRSPDGRLLEYRENRIIARDIVDALTARGLDAPTPVPVPTPRTTVPPSRLPATKADRATHARTSAPPSPSYPARRMIPSIYT